jgi:uracil-DNA glycosylase
MTETIDLNKLTRQYLESLGSFGVRDLPSRSERRLATLEPGEGKSDEESDSGPLVRTGGDQSTLPADTTMKVRESVPLWKTSEKKLAYGPSLDKVHRLSGLGELREVVANCTRCPELSSCRTQTVFGVGSPSPRLCFFGEGPGADEDRLGEPFVGRAGELLNRIIKACKMQREDVYILNTVKCRPPGNRNPHDAEINNCREYFEQQLEILQPEFICALGAVAAKALLGSTESLGRMRGKFHDWRGSKVIVTYHPAYLLRTPEAKAKTWEDMQLLMKAMGVEL